MPLYIYLGKDVIPSYGALLLERFWYGLMGFGAKSETGHWVKGTPSKTI